MTLRLCKIYLPALSSILFFAFSLLLCLLQSHQLPYCLSNMASMSTFFLPSAQNALPPRQPQESLLYFLQSMFKLQLIKQPMLNSLMTCLPSSPIIPFYVALNILYICFYAYCLSSKVRKSSLIGRGILFYPQPFGTKYTEQALNQFLFLIIEKVNE